MGKIALPAFAAVLLTTSAAWAADDEAQREHAALFAQQQALIEVFSAAHQTPSAGLLEKIQANATGFTSSGMKS